MFPRVPAPEELRGREAPRGPLPHLLPGKIILLFGEEGQGSGSPYTPKIVTLKESNLPRARESARWTPKVALVRVRPRPPPVSGTFHRGPCVSSRYPRPAGLDQSVEGPRSLPTRRRLWEQGLLVLRLLQLRRVLFVFLSPSRPVNNPEFLAGLGHLQPYLWALRTGRSFKARLLAAALLWISFLRGCPPTSG